MPSRARTNDEEIVTGKTAEVMRPEFNISDERMESVTDFASALALATDVHGTVKTSTAVRVAGEAEKATMVGKPIVLLEWHFIRSDKFQDDGNGDREFVEVLCVTDNGDGTATKWKMSDGSTGIAKQLREYSDSTGRSGGVYVPHGIRVSEYALDPHTHRPMTREAQRGYDRAKQSY